MAAYRRSRVVGYSVIWCSGIATGLALVDRFTIDLFYIVCFIGFVAVVEMTEPQYIDPPWRSKLDWIVAVGLVGFLLIVIRTALALLPTGFLSL
jgi:hypothetical protein